MNKSGKLTRVLGIIFSIIGGALLLLGLAFLAIRDWGWIVTISVGTPGFLMLLVGVVCLGIHSSKNKKKNALLAKGKYVLAEVTQVEWLYIRKFKTNFIEWSPYSITCKYSDDTGKTYYFKSESLPYNPEDIMESNLLKVYVDLDHPKDYYVDCSSILPNNTQLHKFTSLAGSESLKERGNYVLATTCGTEIVKHPGKEWYMLLQHLMEPEPDKKDRTDYFHGVIRCIGYRVLCRYDAPNGEVHIFASKGRWGTPEQAYRGEQVRVYYEGEDFKKYYVDLEDIQ